MPDDVLSTLQQLMDKLNRAPAPPDDDREPGCWQDEHGAWHGRGWSMSDAMFQALKRRL